MTSIWIKETETPDLKNGQVYFLALKRSTASGQYLFSSEGINGNFCWSVKPGIARRYMGSEELKTYLFSRPDLVAIAVPDDAEERWRRRRRKTK